MGEPREYVLVEIEGEAAIYPLSKEYANTVGRQRETSEATIQLPVATVSRQHCRIEWVVELDEFQLQDTESLPGTYVNDQNANSPVPLRVGDVIRVATVILQFQAALQRPSDFPPLDNPETLRIAADWWEEHGEADRAEACRACSTLLEKRTD